MQIATKARRPSVSALLQIDRAKTAAQIRAARAVLNWSQTQLANRTGLTQRSIHRLEQGFGDLRHSTAIAIQKAFSDAGVQFGDSPDGGFTITVPGRVLKQSRPRK
jgi:transcriptional regulator with XRE-family HTH domain